MTEEEYEKCKNSMSALSAISSEHLLKMWQDHFTRLLHRPVTIPEVQDIFRRELTKHYLVGSSVDMKGLWPV